MEMPIFRDLYFEMEKMLNNIPGVLFVKVVGQEKGVGLNIEEINVVATMERNPKQISRDVQSIMSARFNLDFDHKKVSIAQIEHQEDAFLNRKNKRLKIDSIDYSMQGNQVKAEVKLQFEEKMYTAVEIGPNTLSNIYRIIASATLKAVHQHINKENIFAVEDIEIVQIGKREAVMVAITIIPSEYEEMLLGTALVKGDAKEAVAKATLDALNRRLPKYC